MFAVPSNSKALLLNYQDQPRMKTSHAGLPLYSVSFHLIPIPSLELHCFLNRSQILSLVSVALRSTTRQLLLSNDFKQFLKYSLKGEQGFCFAISKYSLPT